MCDKKPHKHALLIKAWADGAVIEYYTGNGRWDIASTPRWHETTDYRIKPEPRKVIMCNGLEITPMTDKPELREVYFCPLLTREGLTASFTWEGSPFDNRAFQRGLVHATQESAAAHALAMLKTKVVDDE